MSRRTRLLKPPGFTFRFTRIVENYAESMDLALSAIAALSPVVRPLALDLQLGCCFAGTLFFDDHASPDKQDFHIRESEPAAGIRPKPIYASEDRASLVPELTDEAIRSWSASALTQPPPDDKHTVAFRELWCVFSRARYFANEDESELIVVDSGQNEWPAQLLRLGGTTWAPGPLQARSMDAPLSFHFENLDSELSAAVQIGWELWGEPGRPEHELLQGALQALLQLGWETNSVRILHPGAN